VWDLMLRWLLRGEIGRGPEIELMSVCGWCFFYSPSSCLGIWGFLGWLDGLLGTVSAHLNWRFWVCVEYIYGNCMCRMGFGRTLHLFRGTIEVVGYEFNGSTSGLGIHTHH
jgi:hypothetical protein